MEVVMESMFHSMMFPVLEFGCPVPTVIFIFFQYFFYYE